MAGGPRSPGQPQAGPAPDASDGLVAIYQRPNTSKAATAHKIYPYLLGGIAIERVNQVWCSDVTYIPMAKGFLYLVVIMDWVSRAVLAWRLSNTLGAEFCVEALEEALVQYGPPEIFNTDQGSQFTSDEFTGTLKRHGVMISMGMCALCNRPIPLKPENRLLKVSRDRTDSGNKAYEWQNTRLTHLACNLTKSDAPLDDWLGYLALIRQL